METQNKVESLLTDAHSKLDVIKTHMPKIIIAIVVVAVAISIAHGYFGHAGMLTSVN